jgi:lipopolysaccharide export system permease protein
VKLVTRYVVRQHIGPLIFALTALTSLLMLQYVARQLANLAGKGLPWNAIAKFFVLSLPFTIAMTMPMAVLVATLYAFGNMAAEHEITAFKASGVRVRTLMAPVLVCAMLLSIVMVGFNDQVLSRANHELRILQQDISRTKPTLALRDQAMNAINDQLYIRVSSSNADRNSMKDVEVFDLSKGPERKTIYADSGLLLLAPNGKDLQLKLFDGYSQEFVRGDPKRFQRSFFRENIVLVRGITQGFEASRSDTYKGDREMSVCEMESKYVVASKEFMNVRTEYIKYSYLLAPKGTKSLRAPRERPARDRLAYLYCVAIPRLFAPKVAEAAAFASVRQSPGQQPPVQQPPVQQPPVQQPPVQQPPVQQPPVPPPTVTPTTVPPTPAPVATPAVTPGTVGVPPAMQPESVADSISRAAAAAATAAAAVPPKPPVIDTVEMYRGSLLAATSQMAQARESLDSLAVEIQKKFALSFACFVFVLFGPPIALRFPRGGVGVTLGVSIVVFGLYYICLMAGEALADKGKLPAIVAMWAANIIFTLVGVILLWRIESTVDSSRGGGIREWFADRGVKRQLAKERAARQSAARLHAVPEATA